VLRCLEKFQGRLVVLEVLVEVVERFGVEERQRFVGIEDLFEVIGEGLSGVLEVKGIVVV